LYQGLSLSLPFSLSIPFSPSLSFPFPFSLSPSLSLSLSPSLFSFFFLPLFLPVLFFVPSSLTFHYRLGSFFLYPLPTFLFKFVSPYMQIDKVRLYGTYILFFSIISFLSFKISMVGRYLYSSRTSIFQLIGTEGKLILSRFCIKVEMIEIPYKTMKIGPNLVVRAQRD
jgi:hypothetical protein